MTAAIANTEVHISEGNALEAPPGFLIPLYHQSTSDSAPSYVSLAVDYNHLELPSWEGLDLWNKQFAPTQFVPSDIQVPS